MEPGRHGLIGSGQERLLRLMNDGMWARARVVVLFAEEIDDVDRSRTYRDLLVLWRRGLLERRGVGRGRASTVEYRITEAGRLALARVAA